LENLKGKSHTHVNEMIDNIRCLAFLLHRGDNSYWYLNLIDKANDANFSFAVQMVIAR